MFNFDAYEPFDFDSRTYRGFEVSLDEDGIFVIRFNRPERLNGTTTNIKRDLIEVLTQCQMEDRVRVIVFTGTGRAFCAGDDISGQGDNFTDADLVPPLFPGHHNSGGTYNGLRWVSQALNLTIRKLDKLTIAAINGIAIQTGFSLALACDFKIASKAAKMGSATLRFGLLPDEGGQHLLVQHMGVARTMEFLMKKRIVEADEAYALGFVNQVVEADDLWDEAMSLARELAAGPQLAMRQLKQSIYSSADLTLSQSMEEIAARTTITDHHADAIEGMTAFREKRPPEFNAELSKAK